MIDGVSHRLRREHCIDDDWNPTEAHAPRNTPQGARPQDCEAGEYEGGHYMYDGAAFNAVTRSVRWPGCYDFYTLQETGKATEATALQTARCTVSLSRSDYFIYPASFFKLRDVSLTVPIPRRLVRSATSANLTFPGSYRKKAKSCTGST